MGTIALGGFWILTFGAAVWDWRTRTVPNWWWGLGAAWVLLGFLVGWWPWSHLWWVLGTALLWEFANAMRPGEFGYGDVKWSLLVMATMAFGGAALIALTQCVLLPLVGTGFWLARHCTTPWRKQAVPWVTVLWGGWTAAVIGLWLWRG
jgi:hypothetical protein